MFRARASSTRRWASSALEIPQQSHASTSKIALPPARCSYSTTAPTRSTKSTAAPPAAAPPQSATAHSQASSTTQAPLPWLNKPLGVRHKPTSQGVSQTRRERMDYYVEKGRMEERQRIIANAAKGYFHDFHDYRRNGGKSWRAPTTMIRSNRALYFPRIEGTCLKDRATKNTADMCEGKVSVVCLLNTGVSLEHTKSFYEPTAQRYAPNPNFQLVQINLQPNLMKHYLISLFLSSLRSQIPQQYHDTYLLSKLDLDSPTSNVNSVHREDLNVHNTYVGYTYLVDQEGKIRWAGSGFAEPQERQSLYTLTAQLLGEIPGTAGSGSAPSQ